MVETESIYWVKDSLGRQLNDTEGCHNSHLASWQIGRERVKLVGLTPFELQK